VAFVGDALRGNAGGVPDTLRARHRGGLEQGFLDWILGEHERELATF
jgi:hypothetical protein